MHLDSPKTNKPRLGIMGILTVVLIIILVGGAYWLISLASNQNRNYAKEVAQPIEKALKEAGGKKVCERSDDGRGWDNQNPWYHAIYTISSAPTETLDTLSKATSAAGFSLAEASPPPNPGNSKFYEDKTSKMSGFTDLNPGNIELLAEIYDSKVFSGDSGLCTVKDTTNNANETTFDFTINLPDFKK